MLSERVGRRIRRALEKQGWSQARLARELGISEKQISRYVHGKHLPGLRRLERIAELLGVPAEELMYGDDDEPQ